MGNPKQCQMVLESNLIQLSCPDIILGDHSRPAVGKPNLVSWATYTLFGKFGNLSAWDHVIVLQTTKFLPIFFPHKIGCSSHKSTNYLLLLCNGASAPFSSETISKSSACYLKSQLSKELPRLCKVKINICELCYNKCSFPGIRRTPQIIMLWQERHTKTMLAITESLLLDF